MKIYLLGTSHVSPESIEKIKKAFEKEPECVAVELDYSRFMSLKTGQTTSPPGIFLKILGWLQQKLGKMTGVFPGQEMIETAKLAGEKGVYLIDEDAGLIANKIKSIPFTEKLKFFMVPFTASFSKFLSKSPVLRKSELSSVFSLEKAPSDDIVKEVLKILKYKFPNFYKVLVEERNHIMANNIMNLPCDNILIVVGAGHVEGLKELLEEKAEVEVL